MPDSAKDKELRVLEKIKKARELLKKEIHKAIVGQDEVIEQLLVCLFAGGHCLIVGVPGLAKTLLIKTLSQILRLSFNRIQFTPDLMPTDITGTDILEEDEVTKKRSFRFIKGPIFANIILADEINRTPPKTQAALLEAMQEMQVTTGGVRYDLERPFFVLATQNPIEQEGTYPLPEAQLDRFMFNIEITYPSKGEERQIVKTTTFDFETEIIPVLKGEDILTLQKLVRKIPVSDYVVDYAVLLARATRPDDEDAPQFINDWVSWGAGPRAAQYLVLGAKGRAVLAGRYNVTVNDVRDTAQSVLRHRIYTNFNADSEGIDAPKIIERLLKELPAPAETAAVAGR